MNENIDLTEILKDCPSGWEFYSSIYGYVKFSKVDNAPDYPIKLLVINNDGFEGSRSVTKQGLFLVSYDGECAIFPSKEQRDWSKFTAPWLKKGRFDPKTLRPFDKVLVSDEQHKRWRCSFFSHIVDTFYYPYVAIDSSYKFCIPYNDDTKYLVGTTEEAPKFYRYWEN